jgi:hypothetical protein
LTNITIVVNFSPALCQRPDLCILSTSVPQFFHGRILKTLPVSKISIDKSTTGFRAVLFFLYFIWIDCTNFRWDNFSHKPSLWQGAQRIMLSSSHICDESCGSGSEELSLENMSLRGGGRGSSRARGQAALKATAKKGCRPSHGVKKQTDFNQKRSCNIPAAALALLSAAKGKLWQ